MRPSSARIFPCGGRVDSYRTRLDFAVPSRFANVCCVSPKASRSFLTASVSSFSDFFSKILDAPQPDLIFSIWRTCAPSGLHGPLLDYATPNIEKSRERQDSRNGWTEQRAGHAYR